LQGLTHLRCSTKTVKDITRPRLSKSIRVLWHWNEQRRLEAEGYGLTVAEDVNNRSCKRLDALGPMKFLTVGTRDSSRPGEAVARD
jgi:hypothetical protein